MTNVKWVAGPFNSNRKQRRAFRSMMAARNHKKGIVHYQYNVGDEVMNGQKEVVIKRVTPKYGQRGN